MKYGKAILGVALAAMLALGSGYGTFAYFTSQATSSENNIATGTLKLGGIMKNQEGIEEDVVEKFATVTFDNIEPGEPPYKVQTTTLKNVGSLPFYLYRITASDLVDNTVGENDNGKNDTKLNEVINVVITIDEENAENPDVVYEGKLSDLIAENGGHFDPIKGIEPDETKIMIVNVYMDPEAKNKHQGLSMSCDLSVYAAQNEMAIPGKPAGTVVEFGSNSLYTAKGYIEQGSFPNKEWDDTVCFEWSWPEGHKCFDTHNDEYILKIKHEKGTLDEKVREVVVIWNGLTWDVEGDLEGFVTDDQWWNYDFDPRRKKNVIEIRKSAFPEDWKGFEVQFSGRVQGETDFETTEYKYMSLDRD